MLSNYSRILTFCSLLLVSSLQVSAQGTWTHVTNNPPDPNGGNFLLLSDGRVMCKSWGGGSDGIGNIYSILTPDANGSYINGTWSAAASMFNTRLYYSSQVLMDGRVYVCGGEYGSGYYKGETYNPLTNAWTMTPDPGQGVSDANSEILPDGRVLQALVSGSLMNTVIYDPQTNTYSPGGTCLGIHNESVWVKLPDNSILMIDRLSTSSERYIPSTNTWIADATVPNLLYDPYGDETGGAILLPDGRAFFFGAMGNSAYYTPSGNTSPGTWTVGPNIPNGDGQTDAPSALEPNGKLIFTAAPAPFNSSNIFNSPTSYYELDPNTNAFLQLGAPGGGVTENTPCYTSSLMVLPDGNILFGQQDSNRYYVFTPTNNTPQNAWRPTITSVTSNSCNSFTVKGTQFNGLSESSSYGDDWQMNTNYPLVRLTNGPLVYYARTYGWNSTGVARGNQQDTCRFTLPTNLPPGTYQLYVVANGIASAPVSFTPCFPVTVEENVNVIEGNISVYPNPAEHQTTLSFTAVKSGKIKFEMTDVTGRIVKEENLDVTVGANSHQFSLNGIAKGVYVIMLEGHSMKLVVK